MNDRILRVGARTSRLARAQAGEVMHQLGVSSGLRCEFVGLTTAGDRSPDAPYSDIGETGVFTREIERALCTGKIDVAVHSLKDLETEFPEGVVMAAVLPREDPRDALIVHPGLSDRATLATLPKGSRVGTASLRRRALLLRQRSDINVQPIRGNVPSRLKKLADGRFDAIVLAVAGLNRLGLTNSISEFLAPEEFTPAPGQGAVAVQVRDGDDQAQHAVSGIDHAPTRVAITAERAFLRRIEGGCQVPAGALATITGESLSLIAMICSPDGTRTVRARIQGPLEHATDIGEQAADQLLRDGGDSILEDIRAG